ncbi:MULTISPECIES: hypothetical protein [Streptomyces]|uniref:Secreted protein n=1 Tax=Streptomyces flavovirens TaxID=52258 RepID=A0ABV8N203_9ACTN|nr:hypothetical protein [Streptomyces sp. MBT51]MBK3595387.1 hypothetical protein [Streptomyces sp. MBT51]
MPSTPPTRYRTRWLLLLLLAVCVAVGAGAYVLIGRTGRSADCTQLVADKRVQEALDTRPEPGMDCADLGDAILSVTGGDSAGPHTKAQAAAMKGILLAVADDVAERDGRSVPEGLRRPLGTALEGHAVEVYENLNALDFVYSNAAPPSAEIWEDEKGYHFGLPQKSLVSVIRAVSDDPAVYAGLRTALTAEGAARIAAMPKDATGASLTAVPAAFARVTGALDGIAERTAGDGESRTRWYTKAVGVLSGDEAAVPDPSVDLVGHLTGVWREQLRAAPEKAEAMNGQSEGFFTTWADFRKVPAAQREPTLQSCRSSAHATSQRALEDLGD